MKGERLLQGELLKRIVGPALPVGRTEDPDHILTPFQ